MITVVTDSYNSTDITNSTISATFAAGSLINTKSVPYNQLTSIFSLSDPIFIHSFLDSKMETSCLAYGISFIIVSFLFLFMSVWFLTDTKTCHKSMAFIQFLQIIGLSRVRSFPF